MRIIYISSLCSQEKINWILNNTRQTPLQSIQKYHRLLCRGILQNRASILAVSIAPLMPEKNVKKIVRYASEEIDGVPIRYVPFLNLRIIRRICIFFYIFNAILFKSEKEDIFICDLLCRTATIAAFIGCKLRRKKIISIITDRPIDLFKKKDPIYFIQSKFDGYIFLTKQMDNSINIHHKPSVIIEGIADDVNDVRNIHTGDKTKIFTLMYAGGLFDKYGVKNLIKAVQGVKYKNIILELYGSGDLDNYINHLNDSRIVFFGTKSNSFITQREKEVSLLVNPRPTTGEYTKYSFPSKTIEYMNSGTPLLTTKLPGIPDEYFQYCYTLEQTDPINIREEILKLYKLDNHKLRQKGIEAKKWVLSNKTPKQQAAKLLNIIHQGIS